MSYSSAIRKKFDLCRLLPLIALALLPATARADLFAVTLNGDVMGTGSFTTDGICSTCVFPTSLLTATFNLSHVPGSAVPESFNLADDLGSLSFIRNNVT